MHWPSCRSDAWMKESSLGWRQVHLKVMYVLLSTIMIDYACMFFTCLCQDLPVFLRFFPCRLWHEFAMWCHHRSLEMLYHWVDHALGKLTSMQISVRWVEIYKYFQHGSWEFYVCLFVGSGVSNHRAIGSTCGYLRQSKRLNLKRCRTRSHIGPVEFVIFVVGVSLKMKQCFIGLYRCVFAFLYMTFFK